MPVGSAEGTDTLALQTVTEQAPPVANDIGKPVLSVLILALAVGAFAALIPAARKKQLKLGWAALCVVFAAAALLLCVYAPGLKTTVTVAPPEGNPQDTVVKFLDAVVGRDYEKAYSYLYDYASLGLEDEPETKPAQLMVEALRDSYGYELYGGCEVDSLRAGQKVLLDVLDLTALQEDLKAATEAEVARMNEELSERELLDENGQFRKEITDQAYENALTGLLSHPDKYMTSIGLELELIYTQDGWRIMTNSQLLQALSGKTLSGK